MKDLLKVTVLSPREVLFEGEAKAISSKNSQGKFDILFSHANFITLVENQPVIILKADDSKSEFNFKQAIIYNSQNEVLVLAEPTS